MMKLGFVLVLFLKFSDFWSLFLFTFSLVRDRVFLKPKFDWLQAFRSTKLRHEYIQSLHKRNIFLNSLYNLFMMYYKGKKLTTSLKNK